MVINALVVSAGNGSGHLSRTTLPAVECREDKNSVFSQSSGFGSQLCYLLAKGTSGKFHNFTVPVFSPTETKTISIFYRS